MERKTFLIKELHKIGVFYKEGKEIEKLTLAELEYLHISRKCEFITVIMKQKNQPARNKLALA